MISRDFCYWLQGFFEVDDARTPIVAAQSLLPEQVQCIKNHLAMVFRHEIDPSFGDEKEQAELRVIHQTSKKDPQEGGGSSSGAAGGGVIPGLGPLVFNC